MNGNDDNVGCSMGIREETLDGQVVMCQAVLQMYTLYESETRQPCLSRLCL